MKSNAQTRIVFTFLILLASLGGVSAQTSSQITRPDHGEELIKPGIYHVTGTHKVLVENNSGQDAILKIEDNLSGETYRLVYIRKGYSHTITDIKDGTFMIKFALGEDYSGYDKMFTKSVSYTKFDNPNTFVARQEFIPGGIRKFSTTLTVTLAPVVGGDADTSRIKATDF